MMLVASVCDRIVDTISLVGSVNLQLLTSTNPMAVKHYRVLALHLEAAVAGCLSFVPRARHTTTGEHHHHHLWARPDYTAFVGALPR